MSTKSVVFISILSFLLGIVATIAVNRPKTAQIEPITEQVDTLSTVTENSVTEPEIQSERPIREIRIPVLRVVSDTNLINRCDSLDHALARVIRERDSIILVLTRTQREYGDSTYHAWVSGIEPALDSIKVFNTTTYINKTVTERIPVKYKPKFTFGVQAGVGGIIPFSTGRPELGGYIGLGVQYNF